MKNLKVMEAAYNFTDAVIENKEYTIERGFYMLIVKIENSDVATPIALYDKNCDTLAAGLPIRDVRQQELKEECRSYEKELKAAEQREKELKKEFEAWRAKNGK